VGRTWHGGLLFQSEDYGQVAAMRFSLLPTATVTNGVMAVDVSSATRMLARDGVREVQLRCPPS
jgi:hypothetical protein